MNRTAARRRQVSWWALRAAGLRPKSFFQKEPAASSRWEMTSAGCLRPSTEKRKKWANNRSAITWLSQLHRHGDKMYIYIVALNTVTYVDRVTARQPPRATSLICFFSFLLCFPFCLASAAKLAAADFFIRRSNTPFSRVLPTVVFKLFRKGDPAVRRFVIHF